MNYHTNIFEKYDIQVPRYTSYPSVPNWKLNVNQNNWLAHLNNISPTLNSWSLYLHIPFCESLCTFCGCTNIITKNHSKELDYIATLIKELKIYLQKVPKLHELPVIQIHLGGGSPSFLSPTNTEILLKQLRLLLNVSPKFDGSVEVDPRRTTKEHLVVYQKYGFKRLSLGVQDFSPEVQRLINRNQSFEQTQNIFKYARALGFYSINMDLIYGLPKQNIANIEDTIEKTLKLNPDRIALYSFAKVPWIKPQQRLFKDEDLPEGMEKRRLYEKAHQLLITNDYIEIGMDHFAKEEDTLCLAMKNKALHRNFMGYTEHSSDLLLGIGLSSISNTNEFFHQNHKDYKDYVESIENQQIPSMKGHILNKEDQSRQKKILDLITGFETTLESNEQHEEAKIYFKEMLKDHLIKIENQKIYVTNSGKAFLRNICTFFDEYYQKSQNSSHALYSRSI